MNKQDLKALSFGEMERFVQELGWPRYRAMQILRWIYQKGVNHFQAMSDLPQGDRSMLEDRAYISQLKLLTTQTSLDGTRKFLFSLEDANRIESVLIPEEPSLQGGSGKRLTLCISTQVGCTLDCSFCLTGRMGLQRNLKAHEIVDQMLMVQALLEGDQDRVPVDRSSLAGDRGKPKGSPRSLQGKDLQHITHLVLMGMGEPLANFHAAVEAIRRISGPRGIGLSPRRITLSTAGLIPQIRLLGTLDLKINLAISLNATTDEIRNKIMGTVNRKYPLRELIKACQEYPLPPRRRLTFEYVIIRDVNDSASDAQRLIKLLRGIRCKVNLISYNEHPGATFLQPSDEKVLGFQEILRQAGFHAFIRKSKGRDILAACGQLETTSHTVPESVLLSHT